jgi:hypothetical protein
MNDAERTRRAMLADMPARVATDCRTPVGVAVDIIDMIATVAGIAVCHDLTTAEAREALHDLIVDEDVQTLLGVAWQALPAAVLATAHRALLRTIDWALILAEVERRGHQVCLHNICKFSADCLPSADYTPEARPFDREGR